MGIFKNIFNNNNENKKEEKSIINWIPFTSLEQISEIKEQSKQEAIAIFKHSTRCGISRMVLRQFESSFDKKLATLKVYYLDLLNYRAVSDEVGNAFQVQHQSPQLLVIKDEIAIAHASHYEIAELDLLAVF